MSALLGLLLLLQGPPDVTARVDHARLAAGAELVLTVRARTRSAEPVTIVLPALTGFAIVGSREVTEVTIEGLGGPVRTTTRELELRAQRPGTLVIGPVRVRQAGREVTTAPIAVTVDSAAPGLAAELSPIARSLIDAAPPPARNDRVDLSVIIPGDSVLVGQQLDVVAAAWFPRELRSRLRRPPILTLQTPEGVWSYPGAAPAGVAASRMVRGHWMDLFVVHQAVFPLAPGRVVILPASVEYAIPVTFSFFSREDRYSLRSDSVPVTVLALPDPGRASGNARVVGQGLGLDVTIDPPSGRVGEPLTVTATVSGTGNVALWPEPVIRWPPGFRAYPGETGMRVEARDGRIAGIKTFHYLVMPDSAGAVLFPEIRYPYYDLGTGAWAVAGTPPRTLAVAPGLEPQAARALPPLERPRGPVWSDALARDLFPWGALALLVGPPVLAWLARRRHPAALAARAGAQAPAAALPLTRVGRVERRFHAVLASHVPDARARDGDGLARALRASGVESAVADHVMRLRDRLRATRYARHGSGDAAELAAEVEQVLRVLGAEGPGKRRRVVTALGLVTLALPLSVSSPLRSRAPGAPGAPRADVVQGPSAEALYGAGALRVAADSFAARAAAEPLEPAHWYDLGATLYRAGADGKASAAWTVAARLAPRDRVIRNARELLPPPDAASAALLAVGVLTPAEWALAAGALWILLWGAVTARRRGVTLGVLAILTLAAAGLGARAALRRARPLAIVVGPATAVRVAPYGGASAASSVDAGAALLVGRRYGSWLEVHRDDGVRGWVRAAEVVRP